jgi:hypothetical protein
MKGSRQEERNRGGCYGREFSATCQKPAAILAGIGFGGAIDLGHANFPFLIDAEQTIHTSPWFRFK